MGELLLELLSEEMPARMQAIAAKDLARLVSSGLEESGLKFRSLKTFVTPRRLALVVEELPRQLPAYVQEKRGPRIEANEQAIEGFLKANGLKREQCEERKLKNGVFLFAITEISGALTAEVLPQILSKVISDFPWQKSMRWGNGSMRWVRSLERIVCLFDGEALSVTTRNGVDCGNITVGHRFLAPNNIEVSDFADYEHKLRAANVILDLEERKCLILEKANDLAAAEGYSLRQDIPLINEVAGLVEWPVVFKGKIDKEFMDVPDEVLVTSMRAHQKYFSLLNAEGALVPRFLVVANIDAEDRGKSIVKGNERVLRARLSDAKFFWDKDRTVNFESRIHLLSDSIFHAKLGSMEQKAERIAVLAGYLSNFIPDCDKEKAVRAGRLAKADLVTEMVYEFPELQGTMGKYYALNDGEPTSIANAICDHYSPAGPSDTCPKEPIAVAIALADKLDTLTGFYAIDERPTGSRDPFGLRRAALGVIRLVLENNLRVSLIDVFAIAYAGYKGLIEQNTKINETTPEQSNWGQTLLGFFAERLKVHLKGIGIRNDYVEAVFSLGNEDDLVRLLARVDALSKFLSTDDGENLLTAYKRASNIVRIEEKRDQRSFQGEVSVKLFKDEGEHLLYTELNGTASAAKSAISEERYITAMEAMSSLRQPVDLFFKQVIVNVEDADIRINRLHLLSKFRSTLSQIANFSLIEG